MNQLVPQQTNSNKVRTMYYLSFLLIFFVSFLTSLSAWSISATADINCDMTGLTIETAFDIDTWTLNTKLVQEQTIQQFRPFGSMAGPNIVDGFTVGVCQVRQACPDLTLNPETGEPTWAEENPVTLPVYKGGEYYENVDTLNLTDTSLAAVKAALKENCVLIMTSHKTSDRYTAEAWVMPSPPEKYYND